MTNTLKYKSKWVENLESALCFTIFHQPLIKFLLFTRKHVPSIKFRNIFKYQLIPHLFNSTHPKTTQTHTITMLGCLYVFVISVVIFSSVSSEAQMVPAVYVFGDSLVDVGNNNYLTLSIAKANHRHYGVDFPNQKPTGRFSNGKNAADFIGKSFKLLNHYWLFKCSYNHVLI